MFARAHHACSHHLGFFLGSSTWDVGTAAQSPPTTPCVPNASSSSMNTMLGALRRARLNKFLTREAPRPFRHNHKQTKERDEDGPDHTSWNAVSSMRAPQTYPQASPQSLRLSRKRMGHLLQTAGERGYTIACVTTAGTQHDTPASPATARATSVFPVPEGPVRKKRGYNG